MKFLEKLPHPPRLKKIEDEDLKISGIPKKQIVKTISQFLSSLKDRDGDIIKIGNITLSVDKGEAVTEFHNRRRYKTKMIFLHFIE